MIIFKQKQYNSNPEKNPSSYGNSYNKDVVINSGGQGGSQAVRGSNSQVEAAQIQRAQAVNQSEIMRQKSLQQANLNTIRKEKYEGIQDRAKAIQARQVTAINQAKKQTAVVGIQNARETERKKNTTNTTSLYKQPTLRNTPISSNNRTQIKK